MAGAIFVAAGAYFALEALNYDLGTPFRMGPGFMPVSLGAVLVGLGLAIVLKGLRSDRKDEAQPPSWRAIGLITFSVLFFGFAIRGLGFVPTILVGTALTALASRTNSPIAALVIAVGLTVLSALIFVVGLRVNVPLLGPWLGG